MKKTLLLALTLFAASLAFAASVPISVDLKMDEIDYVAGERVRAVIDVKNMSPYKVSVGYANSEDRLFVEIFRAHDMSELDRAVEKPFTAEFMIKSNEGQKLETFLADHFALREPRRYLARPVLVHHGKRYEGQYRAFDIVPGIELSHALQQFKKDPGLSRDFTLVHWTRQGHEHLFLTASDRGSSNRQYVTTDVGPLMRINRPTISILPNGEVIVLHRAGPDMFIRSEFWSMPQRLYLNSRQSVNDPETAAQTRVKELYDDQGGVEAVDRPWWKFW